MVSVGERLSTARVRAFIGRNEQLTRFGEALAGDPRAPFAFYVYGPGGIGKSTLLRRMADDARAAGRPLVELDGRFVSRDPAEFERAAGPFLDAPGTVLVVDSFEHCQWLESWLWHRFLPRAADGALVVLAGRLGPQPQWAADPAWAGLLHVSELEPFSEDQARSLLAAARLRPELRGRVVRFAGGNPLALSLAAAAGSTGCGEAENWLAPPDPEDLATDPVVAAAWEHTRTTDPVGPGEHIGISRFSVYPERYQVPSRVIDLSSSRAQAESARARGRAYGFAVYQDAETWAGRVKGTLDDTGARPRVGEHTYGLFSIDWRRVPVETWLRRFTSAPDGPVRAGPSPVSRATFDQSVREALTHWRDAAAFAAGALMRARLAADFADPVEELRALLRRAVDDLVQDPRGVRAREALTTGYFSGAPTQEAAARRLGLPYGTYRRHLRQGLDLLCEALWQRELHGPVETP